MQWYTKVIKNYVTFDGRARRMEYWMFVLINAIIATILSILEFLLGIPTVLTTLYSLFIFLPSLAVNVRRLHDTGKSGWWILISLVPVVGWIILFVFMVLDSEFGRNKWGPNPKTSF
ncbi:DUF805 domain-containing protein [Virgibacillus siamensis]|uniref:DUF805 domain-containing protein n=1 Tax=Virgibacillus siamensis TaxID=480071 RepID=UPI000986D331|nr:DUF805 domain-containing protein [Virgibacillus siamensis]